MRFVCAHLSCVAWLCAQNLKGLGQAICYLYEKLKRVLASIGFHKSWSGFVASPELSHKKPLITNCEIRLLEVISLDELIKLLPTNVATGYHGISANY